MARSERVNAFRFVDVGCRVYGERKECSVWARFSPRRFCVRGTNQQNERLVPGVDRLARSIVDSSVGRVFRSNERELLRRRRRRRGSSSFVHAAHENFNVSPLRPISRRIDRFRDAAWRVAFGFSSIKTLARLALGSFDDGEKFKDVQIFETWTMITTFRRTLHSTKRTNFLFVYVWKTEISIFYCAHNLVPSFIFLLDLLRSGFSTTRCIHIFCTCRTCI